MNTKPLAVVSPRNPVAAWPRLGALLWLALTLPAAATSLQLSFSVPSSFNESNRQAVLEWNGEPSKTYLVQSADDLSPGTVWKTEEPVRAQTVGPVKWTAPESIRDQKYYRLGLPQTEIYSVEPSFVDSDDAGALFYIIGQGLPTNGTVVINGQNFTPVQVDPNGGWMAISLNGLPPGTPIMGSILALNAASNVVSTLPVQTPVHYGTELTTEQLQGPPDELPASPQALLAAWLSKKGYDYYKAKSDMGSASVASWTKGGGASVGKANPGRYGVIVDDDYPDSPIGLMKAKEKANRTKCANNLRVIPATGEVQTEETDLAIPGVGLDFMWTRTYRSRTGPSAGQGHRWDFSYNVSITQQPDGTVLLRPGNGRADTFYPNGTNGWARDEYFVDIRDLNSDGMPDVLFADGGKWLFNPSSGTPAPGMLAQIVDRNGNTITLNYDVAGRLASIVDTLDRTNTVAYNPAGLVESVTDFSGRTVRYEYDGNGDLTACVSPPVVGTPNGNDFPGGKTNRYTYSSGFLAPQENHLLLSIIDAKGQTAAQMTYQHSAASFEYLRCASMLTGTNTPAQFRYFPHVSNPANSYARTRCIINDPLGNVTEEYSDSRQRCVRAQEFTGRAMPGVPVTDVANRPAGKLRAEDPDYFETRLEWNEDSLCTRVVSPLGGVTEMIYERAFNQNSARSNRRHAGNLRIFREVACCDQDDDGDGLNDSLTTTFEYDPRFGSPAPSAGKKLYVGNLPFSASGRKGWDGTIKGSGGIVESAKLVLDRETGRSKGFGFVVSSMDPRGVVSTAEYDEQGNQSKESTVANNGGNGVEVRAKGSRHNSRGQLTAITNAPDATGFARVDTFDYYTNGPQKGYLKSVVIDDRAQVGLRLTTTCEYDAVGNLTRFVDPRGNDSLYTYNGLDQLVRSQTPTNLVARCLTDYTYDANDNVAECATELRDENDSFVRNIVTKHTFDVLDRPVSVASQVSSGQFVTNKFFYDANDRLVAVQTPLAVSGVDPFNTAAFMYDERGLLFRGTGAPGSPNQTTTQWDYDANGHPIRMSEGLEGTPSATTFTYDGFAKYTAGGGKAQGIMGMKAKAWMVNNYEAHPAFGLKVGAGALKWVETVWNKQCVEKDTTVRFSEIIDPMGNVTTYNYDRNHNLTVIRDFCQTNDVPGADGNIRIAETRYEYDALNRLIRARDSFFNPTTQTAIGDGERITTFSNAPNGQLVSTTDDLGRMTTFAYDPAGRPSSSSSAGLKTVVLLFRDAAGNVTRVTQTDRSDLGGPPQVFAWTNRYDSLNRCISTVDNVGNTNRCAFNSQDNLVSAVDARSNESVFTYDDLSRHVRTTHYEGLGRGITINTSHVEYDSNSQIVSSADANTNTTLYAYDSLNRLVLTTEADGTQSSLIWSPRSNLVREQDANGTVISNSFDLLDRCVRRDITPGAGVAATTTFETFAYDGSSQLVAATNDATHNEFVYDSLGRNTRGTSGGLGAVVSTHDSVGNRLSMTYPGGRVVTYAYDALDQITNVASGTGGLPPTFLADFGYDGPGRLGRIGRANNVNTRIQWNGLVSPPNASGDFGSDQVKAINHQVAFGGPVIDQRRFAYDRQQNKTLRAQTAPFFQNGDMTTNVFEYDPLNRLEQSTLFRANSVASKSYVLDGNDNRQLVVSNGFAGLYEMQSTFPPGDFQMNQYTTTPFASESYDENGNLIMRVASGSELHYEYDYADRLVSVVEFGGGLPVPVASYSYDALGRRISKTSYPSGLPPVLTQYIYDDCDNVIEIHSTGNAVAYTYTAKTGKTGKTKRSDNGSASPVARFMGAGQLQFFQCDDLGNVLALTDAGGNVIDRYEYDDYGAPSFLSSDGFPLGTNASPIGNPFLFHGMEWEPELGLYHVHVREDNWRNSEFLDPQTGRAIRGKVKNIKDMSGSGFVGNNPWSSGGGSGGSKAQDHNSSRSNKTASLASPDGSGGGGSGGSKAQDHNSSRSNKTASIAHPGGGGSGGSKAQDHNSSRSNKTASIAHPGGGNGGGDAVQQLLYKATQGKSGKASNAK